MIELKNVYLSYIKEYYALFNVNLDVQDGQRVALIGDSESGKTTLLRAICGLEKIDKGEIYINKIHLSKVNFAKDLELVYIPTKPIFFENKSVYHNLNYVLSIRKVSEQFINKKINNALRILDIEYLKEKKIKELSFDEKILVSLARAGLREGSVYLIDNIFTDQPVFNEKIINFFNLIIPKEASCLFAVSSDKLELLNSFNITKVLSLENGSIKDNLI